MALDLTATPVRRRALFALLYLAEGAPIGFLWWALPTLLRHSGAEVERIGALLATVGLPWTLKMFGAPLVDLLRGRGVALRTVLLLAQLAMIGTLALAARAGPADLDALQVALVCHAVAAAMQDVAVDALCIAVTPEPERGRVNGWMQFGFQCGRGAFGGGVLWLLAGHGPAAPLWLLVAVLAAVLPVVLLGIPPAAGAAPRVHAGPELGAALLAMVRLRTTWRALAFAVVAAAGFEAVGVFAGPLLSDRGLPLDHIAVVYELPKVAAMMLGGLCGGWCCDRWGPGRATARFQVGFAAVVLLVAGLVASAAPDAVLVAALVGLYFAVGAFTAASYALFMDLTAPRLAATQFSTYMGATNACENWAVWAAAGLSPELGYAGAFAILGGVSLLAVALVPRSQGRDGGR